MKKTIDVTDHGCFLIAVSLRLSAHGCLITAVCVGLLGALMLFHIALTAMTILTAWLFIHTMFAIHYTHEYFLLKEEKNAEMLDFPNDDDPAYWDFLYFSYIIGTSGQTADVAFNTQQSRIIGTIHCVLSFFFNTAILASLINMSVGLIG